MSALSDLQLWQSVDAELVSLSECFAGLVRAAHVPEEDGEAGGAFGRDARTRAPGDLLEVWAEKLVASGHTAVHILSQLKKGALLGDVDALVKNVRGVRGMFEKFDGEAEAKLARMKLEMQGLLSELELSYYSSQHRGRIPSARPISKELEEICNLSKECHEPTQPSKA